MFCPKCGNEYEKGYTQCSDCNISLVENLCLKKTATSKLVFYTIKNPFLKTLINLLFLSFLCLLFFITLAATTSDMKSIYIADFLFGISLFSFFSLKRSKSLFILPLAWILNIIYLFIITYISDLSTSGGFISFGWEFAFIVGTCVYLLPNIILTFVLAIIYKFCIG